MNLEELKETLRKQCNVNHETMMAICRLRKFNKDCNIVEIMNPKSEVNANLNKI